MGHNDRECGECNTDTGQGKVMAQHTCPAPENKEGNAGDRWGEHQREIDEGVNDHFSRVLIPAVHIRKRGADKDHDSQGHDGGEQAEI